MKDIDVIPVLNKSVALNYSSTMAPEEKVNYLVQNLRLTINNLKGLAEWTHATCLDTKWTPFKKMIMILNKRTLVAKEEP